MNTAEREYSKLAPPRQRGTLATRVGLWLGPDHLLCVETEGYAESYKRFYFRDIQAITLRRTSRMLVLGLFTGGCTSFFAILTVGVGDETAKWIFGVLTVLFAIPFIANFIYGPTCRCELRTAVQTEDLPSLSRIRRAQKVIARLQPLIAEAQGQLNEAEVPQLMQELAAGGTLPAHLRGRDDPNAPPVIGRSAAPPTPPPPRHYRGKSHYILCLLLLSDLPFTAPHFFFRAGWLDFISILLMVGTFITAIVALVKQSNTDLPRGLKALPVVTIVANGLFLLFSVFYGLFLGISRPQALEDFSPMEDPVGLIMAVTSTAISAILGATGLMAWRRFHAARARVTPPEAGPTVG